MVVVDAHSDYALHVYSDKEVRKIQGENFIRIFKKVIK